ncbi:MAG: MFS transporter [Myxococcota bacterium]|jgi:UMF1 family MFS transporter|nr:MFS transporter [Myxococcota bacterium]
MNDTPSSATSTAAQRFSWCLYDFANSGFPTVIITAVYVLYFKQVVVGDEAGSGRSDNLWGLSNSLAAAIVFLGAPFLGAFADRGGHKRFLLGAFTLLCVVGTALLALTGPQSIALAMCLVVLAIVGFESACVFYNAFLPTLVPASALGRLSGYGWALGYIGGLGCLLAVLPLATRAMFAVPLVVAAWYLVFSLPALLLLRDRPCVREGKPGGHSVEVLRRLWREKALRRFLVSFFFYDNAVVTIIVFAVAFAADSLAFTTAENIALIVVMNVVAAPSALGFGWFADRFGVKRTLVTTLLIWLLVVVGAELAAWPGLFAVDTAKSVFWAVAATASLAIGAIQATSRAFVGMLAPQGRSGEFYGFMAFAGKGSAILGPAVFGFLSDAFDSQRLAVASVGAFFVVGLALLLGVEEPRR